MKKSSVCGAVLFFAAAFIFCTGWGYLVHRTVHQLAVYQLPAGMQPFFYAHMDNLVQQAIRPDERRNSDPSEGPKHFIDAEVYGDSALWKMPRDWNGAVARYTKDTLEKYGYVPYWVMVTKDRLTAAFRGGNADSILFYAADLGHYIADAHVPLHTSVNYDGQLTGQKGLHHLWESAVPELSLSRYRLYRKHKASYLGNPREAIWNTVQQSFSLLPEVFAQEQEVANRIGGGAKYETLMRYGKEVKSYTPAFARAYNERLGNSINERLLQSAALIADFWYTCWVDAGKPDLEKLLQQPWSSGQKRRLKAERKAYRKGTLQEKGLLLSVQLQSNKQ